jgi:hypothetical protein
MRNWRTHALQAWRPQQWNATSLWEDPLNVVTHIWQSVIFLFGPRREKKKKKGVFYVRLHKGRCV